MSLKSLWEAWEKTTDLFETVIQRSLSDEEVMEAVKEQSLELQKKLTDIATQVAGISIELSNKVLESILPKDKDD